jgi:glyoxylase-like metal-dependent hydrolase (beta-lactamase superfamily II)
MAGGLRQAAEGVTRLGSPLVNFYLVEAEDGLVLVDAGVPGYRRQLEEALAGRRLDAVLLTHAHVDHTGVAEGARATGARVFVHADDCELATTGKAMGKNEASFLPYLRRAAAWRLLWELGSHGGLKPQRIEDVTTYADGETLDVPGRPRALHTPGHTAGHACLYFESAGLLFAGDALCNYNPLTGATGPQLMPSAFNRSSAQALESLAKLEELHADTVLFGHGEPWTQGPRLAVERARTVGVT